MKNSSFIFFLFLIPASLLSQSLTDSLLLEYNFNASFVDSSEYARDASNMGVSFVEDRNGNQASAAYFNGEDSYLEFPNIDELKPQLPASFSFWIKYDDDDYQNGAIFNTSFKSGFVSGIFMNHSASTGQYGISYGNGSSNFGPGSRNTYLSNSSVEPGIWKQMVLVVEDSRNMAFYIDCQEMGGVYSGSGDSLRYSDGAAGGIGRHQRNPSDPPNYFKGAIDDFMYWNRALTQEDVDKLCGLTNNSDPLGENLVVYPNPSNGLISVETTMNDLNYVRLINTIGQVVLETAFSPNLDLSFLEKGMYILELETTDEFIRRRVIID